MHTSDFSVAFLEVLTEDLRQIRQETTVQPAPSRVQNSLTLISSLFAMIAMRWL